MKFILLAAFLAMNTLAFAQATGSGLGGLSGVQRRLETYKWSDRPDEAELIDLQKMFINQEWMPGQVFFKSGRAPLQVPLIFDAYNNTLYYKQGSVIMEFVDTVSRFSLEVQLKTDTVLYYFVSQQPAFQSNTPETFYELLVNGDIKLLRCRARSIQQIKDKELPEERRAERKELYFAATPDGKLVAIYPDVDILKLKMPAYGASISAIVKKEHIKLKTEPDLVELFVHLNNLTN